MSPIKKAKQPPHQLSFCSFSPLLRPRSSARLFICPSACSASSRFRVALSARFSPLLLRAHLSARSEPSRSRLVPAPSGIWLLRLAPIPDLLPCPSPVSHSRNFGSLEPAFFPAPSLPRARFLGPPFHIPRACVPRPFLGRLLYAPCSVRHAVPRALFFFRRIFYMSSTVSWQLSGRFSREIRRALPYS